MFCEEDYKESYNKMINTNLRDYKYSEILQVDGKYFNTSRCIHCGNSIPDDDRYFYIGIYKYGKILNSKLNPDLHYQCSTRGKKHTYYWIENGAIMCRDCHDNYYDHRSDQDIDSMKIIIFDIFDMNWYYINYVHYEESKK